MIKIDKDDMPIWLNPSHIESIKTEIPGKYIVTMVSGRTHEVKIDAVYEIEERIGWPNTWVRLDEDTEGQIKKLVTDIIS